MNRSREEVMVALFEQVSTATGFKYKGRKLILWDQLDPSQFPALFVVDHSEDYDRSLGRGVAKTIINAEIFIYSRTDQDAGLDAPAPSTLMNDLLDAIEDTLAPLPTTQEQTLGGVVEHAWIEGRVEKFPGDLDGEGIAIVPVRLLVP